MKVKLNGNDWYDVTSEYGEVDSVHLTPHTGIDLSMPIGTEIYSPIDGIVEKIVDFGNNSIGRGIYIRTDDNKTMILGHLSDTEVEVGQNIKSGDLLALSGNTGNSTGPHLHLGMKDSSGSFINPDSLVTVRDGKISWDKFIENGRVDQYNIGKPEKGLVEFLQDWKADGFWMAMYDKPFFEVMKDFFSDLFKDLGLFILGNTDLFLLAPAIIFMLGTFIVGKNRFTKYILPLWFGYFVSSIFHKMLLAQ